jgi:hypothetical protein
VEQVKKWIRHVCRAPEPLLFHLQYLSFNDPDGNRWLLQGSRRATGTPRGQRPQARGWVALGRAGQIGDVVETVFPGVIAYIAGEIPHVDGAPE